MTALRRALAELLPASPADALDRLAQGFAPQPLDKEQPLLRHGATEASMECHFEPSGALTHCDSDDPPAAPLR